MARALELARQARVSPNPMVGAVLVQNNQIMAEGYHQVFGGPHAEINAFSNFPEDESFDNTILYVSLEPCSHYGKTPPCVDKIIQLGIPTVVIASLDPNPLVSGSGVKKLREHGIEVITGVLEKEARLLNEVFFKYISTNRPFVMAKSAMTLDGKIADSSGYSKWISSEESREEVQYLRNKYTSIMVGVGTVLQDDPLLTCRLEKGHNPIRIIVDSNLRTPLDSKIMQTANEITTILATTTVELDIHQPFIDLGAKLILCNTTNGRVDLNDLMDKLGQHNIDSILLEGGSELLFSALESQIVDKIRVYIAPKILGGKSYSIVGGKGCLLNDSFQLEQWTVTSNTKDIIVEGYFNSKG